MFINSKFFKVFCFNRQNDFGFTVMICVGFLQDASSQIQLFFNTLMLILVSLISNQGDYILNCDNVDNKSKQDTIKHFD